MNSEEKKILDCPVLDCAYTIVVDGGRFSYTPEEAAEMMMTHVKSRHSWVDVEGIVERLIAERIQMRPPSREVRSWT